MCLLARDDLWGLCSAKVLNTDEVTGQERHGVTAPHQEYDLGPGLCAPRLAIVSGLDVSAALKYPVITPVRIWCNLAACHQSPQAPSTAGACIKNRQLDGRTQLNLQRQGISRHLRLPPAGWHSETVRIVAVHCASPQGLRASPKVSGGASANTCLPECDRLRFRGLERKRKPADW